ncbi:ketoacyl-ACP synthase III [candidate division KSB1 bacterium]|nr:ketoacyl-ACP synthase III [candidate division KSB1 bacterium]
MTERGRRAPAARIVGTGHSVPDQIVTNRDLERIVDTSDDWITTRTGIKERRIIQQGQKTSDFCIAAARSALEMADVRAEELDAIILATISPDMRFPATAIIVQGALGAVNAAAWDISATCSGFMFSLYQGEAMIALGRARKVLVIGAEMLTLLTDWTDRGTCVLFGDGAGAAVLAAASDDRGILSTYIGTSGDQVDLLYCIGQGTQGSLNNGQPANGERYIRMNGNEVFRHAVRTMGRAAAEAVARSGLTADDIDWLVPHQANTRIIDATAERMNMPPERVYVNISRYGNTSSASIPIALDEARRTGVIKDGQVVLTVAFGGGFTWGSAVIRF